LALSRAAHPRVIPQQQAVLASAIMGASAWAPRPQKCSVFVASCAKSSNNRWTCVGQSHDAPTFAAGTWCSMANQNQIQGRKGKRKKNSSWLDGAL